MGAIVIGIGVAVAALGIILGAIGFGSAETTSGASLMTVGSAGFVGGLLMVALGFILRVLQEIAERLDGAVHFEPDEDDVPVGRVAATALAIETEEFAPVAPAFPEETRAPQAPAYAAVEDNAAAGDERAAPSWFRRKRQAETSEPAYEAERDYPPQPEAEPLPPFRSSSPEAARPAAHREPPPFLRGGPSVERPSPAGVAEESFEPARPPRPRESFAPEPGAPPAFLRETDLLAEEPEAAPAEPEVTVLKSGTIGGMTYKLYSDGSIEADLPDGTLRFASLQELRDHVAGGMNRG